jgi:PAS domain S-box-containing protein
MSDNQKTQEQLIQELQQLRQKVAALESERQQAEQAQASEQLLRSIIDATPDWIFIKDQEHRYRLVNQGYADALHLQPDDFIGKDDLELGFPEELVKGDPAKGIRGFWTDDRQVMDSGEPLVNPYDPATIDDQLHVFHTIKTPLHDAQGNVWGVLAFARDVTEREKLLEQATARQERLTTLNDISRGLSGASDEDELLQAIILPAQRAGASAAVLMYIDLDETGEPEWLEMAATWLPEGSVEENVVPVGSRFYLPDFLFSSLWMSNPDEAQLIADVTQDERIDENFGNLLAQMGSRALVTIPLTQAGLRERAAERRWVGLVNLSWDEPHAFSPQEAEIYAALTDLASPAVDNYRLSQQTEAALAEIETLYNAGRRLNTVQDLQEIVAAVVEEVPVPAVNRAVLFIYERDSAGEMESALVAANWYSGQGTPPTPPGQRYPWQMFSVSLSLLLNSEPIFIDDAWNDERVGTAMQGVVKQQNVRALAALPLWVGARQLGTLLLQAEETHHFSEREIQPYISLARQMAVVIDAYNLHAQTQDALAQTEMLYSASQALITAGEPEAMLRAITGPALETEPGVATLFYVDSDAAGQPEWVETVARVQTTDAPAVPIGTRYYIPEFPLGHLMIAHPERSLTIGDLEKHEDVDENTLQVFKMVNARSMAIIPLTFAYPTGGWRWLGVITLSWPETRQFSLREKQLYDTLAPQLATLIENQRLLEQMQHRTVRLQTASQVSRAASSFLEPDELIQQVVDLVREQFDLYYVGLFLSDRTDQWAVLRAGTGEAGRQMLERGHKLEIGGESMIGACVAQAQARIALDVGQEAVRFDNPFLPETRSEMALPLIARGQAIGAMTVQSVEEAAFSQTDVTALQNMVDQVANAIENARLFEQTQATLAEARQSEQLLRSIIDATPDLIFVKDPEHRFQLVNRSFSNALGLTPQDFIGKNDIKVGFPEERVRGDPEKGIRGFWADDDEVIESGKTLHSPRDIVMLEGEPRIMNFAKIPLRDTGGNVWGLLGIGRDVTERENLLADLQQRSQDLQTAAEVSSAISSILDPDELNQQVVNLVQERFGLYYAGLFLVDQAGEWSGEPNKWAVLRAGTGKAGQVMMMQGHKLEIGGESMIGSCIAEAQARIALDVGQEAVRFDNPLLPETRSEMALPLIARGQAVGAMTIQSEKEAAFSDQDITVLQTLADQVATAIQNGRLYQESIVLYMASQAVAQAETVDEALAGAARHIIGPLYDTCAVLTFVETGQHDTMEVLAAWEKHPGATPLPVGAVVSQKRFPLYNLIARRETTIFNDLLQDERLDLELGRRIKASGVQSALAIPLTAGPNWLGTLLAQGSHATAIGPENRRAFESLAHQLGAFIQNARLLEETQRALQEIQRLHRSYISEAWQEYLSSTEETTVADYMLDQRQLVPNPGLEFPEIDMALQQNRIVVGGQRLPAQPDETMMLVPGASETHSMIVAPISLRDQVIGTLGIHDPSGERNWDEDDIALLEAVSIQLGLAIDNARLSEQTRTSLAETQTLFDTSRNLAAAQGIEEIQEAIVEAAGTRRVDACALFLFNTLERNTARELVLVAGWDRQGNPRLPVGARLPLDSFELFDTLDPDQPFPITNLKQADNIDEGTRNLLGALGFMALLHQPIAVRGRWFGLLTILHESPHPFSRAEINFYRTLADQAALAIEGQRLLTETQQRAEREQLIRQITEKVHDTPDMETILQTTVQELSKAMGLPRVFVRLGTKDTLSKPKRP